MPKQYDLNNRLSLERKTIYPPQTLESFGGPIGTKLYSVADQTEYILVDDASYVVDGTTIRSTKNGGNTRWVGISGKYNAFQPLVLYGTGSPPSTTGLKDGTLYIQYTP
ncbi:MAG TPA: hypothetical protein PLI42_01835 [Candidatus Pacearchaeota archaeon]|nr:hypothetical protein [Candidatus Pacearchaeota archaeon]